MKREWSSETGPGDQDTLTVLQWNILAQSLGEHGDFSLCPAEDLTWQHRQPLIVQELLREKADLLCLQEVDCFQQLTEHLQPKGYSGVWVPKPWSPCLKFPGNQGPDGNAVFFRREVFTFLSSHSRILELQSGELSGSTVLVCELEHRATRLPLTVLTTHLKAKQDPEFVEIRRQQADSLVSFLGSNSTDNRNNYSNYIPFPYIWTFVSSQEE